MDSTSVGSDWERERREGSEKGGVDDVEGGDWTRSLAGRDCSAAEGLVSIAGETDNSNGGNGGSGSLWPV